MKEIKLRRLNSEVLFEAIDTTGARILVDGSSRVGGVHGGPVPTALLLMSLGGCTGIDVVSILKKMKQPLNDIEITIKGEQRKEVPPVFTKVHIHYIFYGDLKEDKVKRAIELSNEKYCTITKMIEDKVEITSSYEILDPEKD